MVGSRSTRPSADVGYVFLFFYGLERRVLVDAKSDPKAMTEVPAIAAEIESLRSIYSNRSFQSYTRNFLDYVSTLEGSRRPSGEIRRRLRP